MPALGQACRYSDEKAQPLPHGGSTLSAKADIKKVMATVVSSLKGEFAVLLEGLVEGPNLG